MRELAFSDAPFSRKLPSAEEMASCDASTIASGISSAILVERAGKAVFERLVSRLGLHPSRDTIAILCGPGNNGADGLVVGRLLLLEGFAVHLIFPEYSKLSEDCQAQSEKFLQAGGKFIRDEPEKIALALRRARVIVDALLGTGQREAPRGAVQSLLAVLQDELPGGPRTFVALDLPTGVNADTGEVFFPCFRAELTICIELVKRGMLQYPARSNCGDIEVVSIGIDCGLPVAFEAFDGAFFRPIPQRRPDAHKGSFGSVLIIGGSASMPGAPVLASQAALRSGAGLVRKAQLSSMGKENSHPELILVPLRADSHFNERSLAELETELLRADCIVLGPGVGLHHETAEFVQVLCDFCSHNLLPVVIDADAITLIAPSVLKGKARFPSAVLTPHPGEMGRLLGRQTPEVQADRFSAVLELHEKTGATVVLKGAASVVKTAERGFVNLSGNPFMATAGSGDVLCGVLATLLAQSLPPEVAVPCAVWAHGKAGDIAHQKNGGPIIASDIIAALPESLALCYSKQQ